MPSRREILLGTAGAALSHSFGFADPDWQENLKLRLAEEGPEMLGARKLPANDPLWEQAHAILERAAAHKVPYKMAQFLADPKSNPDKFRKEWKDRVDANPVIYLLWSITDLRRPPEGDETPWCATFVSWCLARAEPVIKGKGSSSSQQFLKWGNDVWKPGGAPLTTQAQTGDICVFTNRSNPGTGHVAFFHRLAPDQPNTHVEVLGGNQSDSFKISKFSMTGSMPLMAVRTMDGLRVAPPANTPPMVSTTTPDTTR